MIDFTLTEEQELLLESLEEWLEQCPYGDEYFKECWEESRYPVEFMKELMNSTFGTLGFPEEFGGTPIDAVTMALYEITMTKHGYPPATPQLMNTESIVTFGKKHQIERAMEGMKQGLMPSVLAATEPNAGSDSSAITTSYVRKDGKIILNGVKTMCTNANHAAQIQVLARDFSVENRHKAITAFIIDPNAPGVTISPIHKIGCRYFSMCDIFLDNVELTEDDIFGQEHMGFYQLMHNFETERLCICAAQVGTSMLAYNDAYAYAQERVQFGQKIGDFQLIRELIANMAMKIENMRNLIYHVGWMIDNKQSIRAESAEAKLYITRSSNEICDDALQIMGGIGYSEDCRISKLWRDVRVSRIGGGTDQIMINNIYKAAPKKF